MEIDITLTAEELRALEINKMTEAQFQAKAEEAIRQLLRNKIAQAKHILTEDSTLAQIDSLKQG